MVEVTGTMAAAGAAATIVATSTAAATAEAVTVVAFKSRGDLVLRTVDGAHVHIDDRGPDSYTLHHRDGANHSFSEPMTRALAAALIPQMVEGRRFPLFGTFRAHVSMNAGQPKGKIGPPSFEEIDIKTFLTKLSTIKRDTPEEKMEVHTILRNLVYGIETYPQYLMREDVVDTLKMIMEKGIGAAVLRVIISERPDLFAQEDMPIIAQIAKKWPGAEWDMLRLLAVRDDLSLSLEMVPLTHAGEQPARA